MQKNVKLICSPFNPNLEVVGNTVERVWRGSGLSLLLLNIISIGNLGNNLILILI